MTGAIVDSAEFAGVCVICYGATATLRVTDRARWTFVLFGRMRALHRSHRWTLLSGAGMYRGLTCVGKLSQRGVLPLERASSR
jgi:hypothetical protein